jgi:fatty-acyl-CoA synthase
MGIRLVEPDSNAYQYPLLIKQLLHTPLAVAPDQEIIYRDAVRYTYRDLRNRIGQLANALAAKGVEQGMTVAVLDWDSHRYLECFFAVPMMGAVLQTVNIRLAPEQILYTLRHAKAEVVLTHRDFLPVVEKLREHLPEVKAWIAIADGATESWPAWFDGEYEALLGAASPHYEFPDFDENAMATTFYTTGTTGDPKGVFATHRQLVLHTLALMGANNAAGAGQCFRGTDVYMPMTPMFHVHAWGNPYAATLMGVKQVYPGRYLPEELLALRARHKVTYSHCVPAILQMLLKTAATSKADLKGWKIVIGGSALPEGVAREALSLGIDVWAGYGMSETGPVLTKSRLVGQTGSPDDEVRRRCRAGMPIPLVDLRIVDPEMRDVPRDGKSTGEIVARAPWTTLCYVGNPAASKELWRGGYLHTQDVGLFDDDGYLQITDRTKDVIKTGGEWLSSLELESIISRHAGVAEVAVVGVQDDRWGERPLALVVLRPGFAGKVAVADIQKEVDVEVAAGVLPRYAIPERVLFIDALDRTSVGKIDKKVLRLKYAQ